MLQVVKNDFMSHLSGIDIGTIQNDDFVKEVDNSNFSSTLYSFGIVEWVGTIQEALGNSLFYEYPFVLVDSKIVFESSYSLDEVKDFDESLISEYKISKFSGKGQEKIEQLVLENFVYNKHFFSRYKNKEFFPEGFAEKYFLTWIRDCLTKESCVTMVAEYQSELVGFFLCEKVGEKTLKGILTSVTPEHRGKNLHYFMQMKAYCSFSLGEFIVNNTTQLTNLNTIRSHIRARKNLDSIVLTYYLNNKKASPF